MEGEDNTGGRAFPSSTGDHPGMTLRDYFAGQALAAIMREAVSMGDPSGINSAEMEQAGRIAYQMADCMLVAR